MQITEISYRELVNTGNYQNVTVEMKATIDKDEDLDMCMTKLSRKVKRSLNELQEARN
ncbi:MAG: hypothetical protein PF518_04760 [Spirochaetaceae bacterium]|nr:hypothetical protein [Spirochaetaceae bacterium]